MTVFVTVINALFLNQVKNGDCVNTFSYPLSVGSSGKRCLGLTRISCVLLKELDSIQKYGMMKKIARIARPIKIL